MAYLISAACGLLLTLALPPLGWWPLAFAIFPVFALTSVAASARRAFWLGAAFAAPFFALYILWLPRSFAELFGLGFWAVYPGLLAILATFWGLTTWAAWRLAALTGGNDQAARATRVLIYLPILWVLVEWARTQGYFAFPWGTLGYTWLDSAVGQLAEYGGVYGLSLLVVAPAAVLAWPWSRPGGPRTVGVVSSSLLAAAVIGATFIAGSGAGRAETQAPTSGEYRALLVQGDVDPFGRAASDTQDLNTHLRLTEEGAALNAEAGGPRIDLVVWPEGAVLGYSLAAGDAEPLRRAITDSATGATFIVGGRVYEAGRNYNSLLALKGGALIGRYDKRFLVPFGERWPLYEQLNGLYRAVFSAFGLPMLASTAAGAEVRPLATDVGLIGAFVCYESVFPQVQRDLVALGAEVLVLGTNDAWFGVGTGAWQHFDMGRLRSIETRRWLLRAGNDGVTAAVDPLGRVTAQVPRGVPTSLAVTFETRTDLTFWVRYGGLTPLVLGVLLLVAMAVATALRSRPAQVG